MKKLSIHFIVTILFVALCFGCYRFIMGGVKSDLNDRFLFVSVTALLCWAINGALSDTIK